MTITALGRYEIRGEVGRGNMGVVYRAHDPFTLVVSAGLVMGARAATRSTTSLLG